MTHWRNDARGTGDGLWGKTERGRECVWGLSIEEASFLEGEGVILFYFFEGYSSLERKSTGREQKQEGKRKKIGGMGTKGGIG